ncbi:MAG: hypothetical protein IJ702_04815, partial [Fretibacterium sp.]|nr:hypothetical protein [Fretibacterium sp.]
MPKLNFAKIWGKVLRESALRRASTILPKRRAPFDMRKEHEWMRRQFLGLLTTALFMTLLLTVGAWAGPSSW